MNDLHTELEHCRVLMYADDTVIFYSNASSKNIEEIINKEVQCVADWLQENILVINLKKGKTEFVLYGTAKRLKNAPCVKVEINGIEVTNNEVYEYMGVHVDKTLSFSEQFDKIYHKAAKRLGLLHRIRQKLLCLSTSNSRRLERLQERAEKCVYGGSTPIRRWPSIESVRNRQATLFTYKCMNGLGPEIFSGCFQRFNHGKRTRGDGINLELPKLKLEAFRKSIKYQGPLLFNKLPPN